MYSSVKTFSLSAGEFAFSRDTTLRFRPSVERVANRPAVEQPALFPPVTLGVEPLGYLIKR